MRQVRTIKSMASNSQKILMDKLKIPYTLFTTYNQAKLLISKGLRNKNKVIKNKAKVIRRPADKIL
jgi:hypothetical protein